MSGKDDDSRSDLDKWLDAQRAEMNKVRQQFDEQLRSWTDDASTSIKSPFERFKNFVDDNFSTFAEGFKNFPSNVSELKAKMQQEREARRQEELDISRKWVGTDDSPDHIRMQVDRQSADERHAVKDATYMLLREAYERNKHVSPEKILKLFQDNESNFGYLDQFATPMLSYGGACYYKNETVENLPSTARWGSWLNPRYQWLSVDWFKRSPYSPLRLEDRPDLNGPVSSVLDSKWRAAFEDLLCAALDKPMKAPQEKVGQRFPYGNPQSTTTGPGLDWMLSLQCRGILPPQLPSLYKPVRLFDGFDEAKRPRAAEFMHNIDSITADKSTRMYPLVKRDLSALMDEIAIKSSPTTKLAPVPVPIAQSPWRVPETEEELYDDMPPYTALLRPEPLKVPEMTGKRFIDRLNAEDVLWQALDDGDVATATKCLDAYCEVHNDVDDLVGEEVSLAQEREEKLGLENRPSWYPILMEAMRRRTHDAQPSESKSKALSFDSVEEEEYDRFPLKDKIENRPDVEAEKATKAESEVVKRPDILSQLTTTQTTRMPDGTVTTKVVLKQRFADGREEVHESVQTSRDEASYVQQPDKEPEDQSKEKKKGWFWN